MTAEAVRTALLALVNQWRRDAIQDFRVASEPNRSDGDKAARRDALTKAAHADRVEVLAGQLENIKDGAVSNADWIRLCRYLEMAPSYGMDEVLQQLDQLIRAPYVPQFVEAATPAMVHDLLEGPLLELVDEHLTSKERNQLVSTLIKFLTDGYIRAYLKAVPTRPLEDIAKQIGALVEDK